MARSQAGAVASRLVLDAAQAADLMSPNPVSLNADALVADALAVMTQRGFSAAPVIDEAGRPAGVLSRSDILVHEREVLQSPAAAACDLARVRDIMTPAVFSVPPHLPADRVVEQLLTLDVHQLYVVDDSQALVGVITAHDVLRRLRPE
jgi:CBS domain-containing protein